jgi:uncharacterized protein YcnI
MKIHKWSDVYAKNSLNLKLAEDCGTKEIMLIPGWDLELGNL